MPPRKLSRTNLRSLLPRDLSQDSLVSGLTLATDLGLAAVIFFAPLFMGGRHPLGKLVFVMAVCWAALAWMTRQCISERTGWNRSPAQWLILAAVVLVALQITPLPHRMVNLLSPSLSQNLPLWNARHAGPVHLGSWNQISMTPSATRGGLMLLLAYGLLFIVVLQRVRVLEDVGRLLRCIALAAMGMAVIGFLQFLFGETKFLWVYEHPFRAANSEMHGAFSNQNHCAHFFALGIPPALWWALQENAKHKRQISYGHGGKWASLTTGYQPLLLAGLLMLAVGGLLTFSRGGTIVVFLATAISVSLYARYQLLGRASLISLGVAGAALAIALTIHGSTRLADRLATLAPESPDAWSQTTGREVIWNAVLAAVPRYAVMGSGVGSHREVYPQFIAENSHVEYTYAESGYLQLLLETGLPGFTMLLTGIVVALGWWWRTLRASRSQRHLACAVAAGTGLVISAVHSVADFMWYIPACMSFTVILAACTCRLWQMSVPEQESCEWTLPRQAWIGATVATLLLSLVMVQTWWGPAQAAGPWESYRVLSRNSIAASRQASLEDAPEDPFEIMIQRLEETLRHDPNDARAHMRLAGVLRRAFDYHQRESANAMGLTQIRDAAVASQFPSSEALDQWLAVAIGPSRELLDRSIQHARRGLQLCPLQGEGYIYLAELSFLEGEGPETKPAYVNQALRLRPHNAAVLLAAGSEMALAGNIDAAIQMWKRAFHDDRESQARIIELVGPAAPADFFVESFDPDRAAGSRLVSYYRRNGRTDEAQMVARRVVAQAIAQAEAEPLTAAAMWNECRTLYQFLGEHDRALEAARRAVASAPSDFRTRREYAELLFQQQRYAEAVEEMKWCLSRNPKDEGLQNKLLAATKAMRDGTSRSAQSEPAKRR